ncbi:DUF7312 domain-containing protein [Salarchaeum japonicum]|uniref:DUF7312 domain-containing protein n=1 Tax=Salarchaeum japonicum TaxID=555573 RepID=A0AAV3T255_9EURY|nr:hypothetical protein [Salarchaeum japonicum]
MSESEEYDDPEIPRPPPIDVESPDPENVAFFLLGVALAALVIAQVAL